MMSFMRRGHRYAGLMTLLALSTLVVACKPLPEEALDTTATAKSTEDHPAGENLVSEPCRYHLSTDPIGPDFASGYNLFCGTWEQPSGRILLARTETAAGGLAAVATGSGWRAGLDQRMTCNPPKSTSIIGASPAALLECTRRNGGWPHLAMVADVGGKTFFLDGAPSSLPAMEAAIADITGIAVPSKGERSTAEDLIRTTIAAKPFGSGDRDTYDKLRHLGDQANDAGDYAAAEQAYKSALAIQERYLGHDSPGLALPVMGLALQVSNQDRIGEADAMFDRAERLTVASDDPLTRAQFDLYSAEHQSNQGRLDQATALATRAEHEFRDLTPSVTAMLTNNSETGRKESSNSGSLADSLFIGPEEQNAISGLAATWWFESYLAFKEKHYPEAEADANRVMTVLRRTGLNPPGIVPRAVEISALTTGKNGNPTKAEAELGNAAQMFSKYQASERPAVVSLFLAGRSAAGRGAKEAALGFYRQGADLARKRHTGLPIALIGFYLQALEDEKSQPGADAAALAGEGFGAIELVETDQTSKVLAQAFARLSAGESKTRDLLRTMQDADRELGRLFAQRDAETQKPDKDINKAAVAQIDDQIAKVQEQRKAADDAAQAASPGYAQLVAVSASVPTVQGLLRGKEGLLTYLVDAHRTFGVLITKDLVRSFEVKLDADTLAGEVSKLRRSIEPDVEHGNTALPTYDLATASAMFDQIMGPIAADFEKLDRLVVVPSGPLTGLPLEVLVDGKAAPVTDGNYINVPFLLNKLALSYFPSPQNFVLLRSNTRTSSAPEPYIGFGNFKPATTAQLTASFPPDRCGPDLAGLEQLPLLPGTQKEVGYVGKTLYKVPDADIVLGDAFTKKHLMEIDLSKFRIVHLATHALLPTNLSCQAEPTVVVSADPDDKTAASSFLKLSDIVALKLDADLVVLSACNTGPQGKNTGDSLSGLARSFFFTGARGLMVTHWELSDAAAPLLTALTLRPTATQQDSAEALRDAKMTLLHEVSVRAGKDGNFYTHPFIWGAFVLVGDGFRSPNPAS